MRREMQLSKVTLALSSLQGRSNRSGGALSPEERFGRSFFPVPLLEGLFPRALRDFSR